MSNTEQDSYCEDYTASAMLATCDSQRLLTAGVRRVDPVTPRSSALTPALPTSSNRVTQFFVLCKNPRFEISHHQRKLKLSG
jgi:hypothetical protein